MRGYLSIDVKLHCFRCGKYQPKTLFLSPEDTRKIEAWAVKDKGFVCDHCGVNLTGKEKV